MIFAYDAWNREHVEKHGVSHFDAEYAVEHAKLPYPKKIEEGKFIVYGADRTGRIVEVVFAFRTGEEIDFNSVDLLDLGSLSDAKGVVAVYIIHAMPIRGRRKRRYRRGRR